MSDLPQNVAELVDRLGGTGIVAKALRVKPGRVSAWKRRDRVNSDYWAGLVALARDRRVRGVTLETISRLHTRTEKVAA